MKNRNNPAQSTLEYLVVLTVIILAILVAMRNFAAKDATKGMGKLMDSSAKMITNGTQRLLQITQ